MKLPITINEGLSQKTLLSHPLKKKKLGPKQGLRLCVYMKLLD